MPLTPGTRLGTFEIVALLGAGGMGEVYRARDSRLDREVAIKVLPDRVAEDAERLTRFEREAKALAALNHPNIAQIYAVEGRALVMELVDGANLSGPLPLETAVCYAAQIADALEAAHEKGIVHRDLKPANVMITPAGTVKVLDFGLAAMPTTSRASAAGATNSPTMTIAASQAGTIMGTAGYMSPEQAAGKPVDRRADIWSFGVVFWELLTGQALFSGETVSHTLADVLRKEIDLNALPKNTPPAVRTLLGRCLDRDVRTRLRDIGEARVLLSRPMQPALESQPASKVERTTHGRWPWLAAAVCAAAIPAAWFLKPAPEEPMLKFDILPPPGAALGAANWGTMQVSPDGNNLALVARDRDRVLKLFVRNFRSGASVAMPGTENALAPAWSPDSSQLAFLAAGKLKRLELSGSQVIEVCDAAIGSYCMWHGDGNIYVSCADHVLRRVRASGGTLSAVFPDSQLLGASPAAIPGHQAFIYQVLPAPSRIVLASPDGNIRKTLLPAGSGSPASFALNRAGGGWLLHRKGTGQLAAVAFDPGSESLRGEESIVVQNVSSGPSWSTSNNGVLAYRAGGWGSDRQLTWVDRSGTQTGTIGEPSNVFTQRISPDQKSMVFTRIDAAGTLLYVHDLVRGTTTRLSSESSRNAYAEWMPDSKSLIYSVQREALGQHAILGASGEKILQNAGALKPTGVSPDGKWLLSASITVGVPRLVLTSLETGKDTPFGRDMAKTHHGSFSPDGRWIVYSAFINGRWDVFVRPVPAEISGKSTGPSGQVQISRAGGLQPVWRGDGKEIFYVAAGGMLTAVPTEVSAMSVRPGTPAPLFQTNLGLDDNFQREYDVTADGKRFLLPLEAPSGQTDVPITVVINWPKLIEKK